MLQYKKGNRKQMLSSLTDMRYVWDTLHYTLYVGPHYTVTSKSGSEDEDPLYVKHFFGNKRDVSELWDSRVLL